MLNSYKDRSQVEQMYNQSVKPLGLKWMLQLYDYLKACPEIKFFKDNIQNGIKSAGICDCFV